QAALVRFQSPAGKLVNRTATGLHAIAVIGSPQHDLDPRDQFPGAERLGNIIIRAQFQTDNAVQFFTFSADENDRNLGFLADMAAKAEAVFTGHHDVEQYNVEIKRIHDRARLAGIAGLLDPESLLGQIFGQWHTQSDIVIDQ